MSSKRILVADDEILISLAIEAALRDQGHEVSIATSTLEALAVLGTQDVDLAILDYHLGRGGCDALVERLRASEVPFVVCSGVAGPSELGAAFTDVPFLPKPFSTADLLNAVGQVASAGSPQT